MLPVSLVAKTVLFSMGWSLLDNDIFAKIVKYKRSVLVFSHTSYADFYILILYLLAYPTKLDKVRTLVKPQPFEYAGYFLRKLGAIPSTRVEDKDGGAVNRIVSELKALDTCIFLISPKGTIVNRPWRSGYYHIAKELDAKIMVAGLDYEKKSVIIFDAYSCNEYDESDIQSILQSDMSNIVPLFPEGEVVPIRAHDQNKRTIVNGSSLCFSVIICIIGYITYNRL
jgi:1-acyl-sn-glycerol-3-phosphate acyltransferase